MTRVSSRGFLASSWLVLFGVGESVGTGAGFDDGAPEGESVDNRCAQPDAGERFHPARE